MRFGRKSSRPRTASTLRWRNYWQAALTACEASTTPPGRRIAGGRPSAERFPALDRSITPDDFRRLRRRPPSTPRPACGASARRGCRGG